MKKIIYNKHFISALGLAIICTSVFLLFGILHKSEAQTAQTTFSDSNQSLISSTTISGTESHETNIANAVQDSDQTVATGTETQVIESTIPSTGATEVSIANSIPESAQSIVAETETLELKPIEANISFVSSSSLVYKGYSIYIDSSSHPDSLEFIVYDTARNIKDRQNGIEISASRYKYNWLSSLPFGKYRIVAMATFQGVKNEIPMELEYRETPVDTTTVQNKKPVEETSKKIIPTPITVPPKTTVEPSKIISPIPKTTTPKPPTPKPTSTSIKPIIKQTLTPLPKISKPIIQTDTVVDATCLAKGMKKPMDCRNYLALPAICRKNKLISSEACDSFLDLSPKCQEKGITDLTACQKYLKDLSLPKPCHDAGVTNQEECRALIQKNNLPEICRQAGLDDFMLCQALVDKNTTKPAPTEKCASLGINDTKLCDAYLGWSNINPECDLILISDKAECRKYLLSSFGAKICREVGINEAKECENFISNKIYSESECQGDDAWSCSVSIEENLDKLLSTQSKYDRLEKAANSLPSNTSVKELNEKIGSGQSTLPLIDDKLKLKIITTKKQIIVKNEVVQTSAVALMIDSDGDGLSDDMEKRIGTNSNNIDTDGDDYDDYVEYKNAYNPLGSGKIVDFKPAPVDEAILNGKSLEHPKVTKDADSSLDIKDINLDTKTIKGKALPDMVYTLFVYSDLPIVTTVRTDEFGNWQYVFQESMINGQHEVYFALNDNTGKILSRSNPFNFFIKEARAITIEEYVSSSIVETKSETNNMLSVYIIISLISTIAGVGAFIIYIKFYKKNLKA